jgi:hypothetical protein
MRSIEHGCLGRKNMTAPVVSTPGDKLLIPESYLSKGKLN